MTDEKDKLLDHDYDGIREYDNMLPSWWLNIFYITIVFAVGYYGYYHLGGPGKSPVAIYEAEEEARVASQPPGPKEKSYDHEALLAVYKDTASVEEGHKIFSERCTSCHGQKGEGGVGPNLTDEFWLHGGKIENVAKTIHDGVPDKGMVTWGQIMSDKEIMDVAAYVKHLAHTDPPNAKAPQGTKEAD